MMRLGHYRPVHVKSKASQLMRTTLIARRKFVDHMLAIEDSVRGLLKVHGLKLGLVDRARFAAKVEAMLADAPELRMGIEPLLDVRNMMRAKKGTAGSSTFADGTQGRDLQTADGRSRQRSMTRLASKAQKL